MARLHKWIWKNKTHLITSPKPNDCVNYKHPVTGEVERMQNMLHNGSVRELHLQMIKPVSECGFDGAHNSGQGPGL